MIPFFRKIRKKLADDNKPMKYIRYAIGEIILVMVGILWNGAGAITLALIEPVQWSWLPVLLIGSFVGGYLGAHLAVAKGNVLVKRTFESMTILTGIALLIKAW